MSCLSLCLSWLALSSLTAVVPLRHGTVCPKYIDYINFVNKDGSDVNQDSVANTPNMFVWRELYEKCSATMPGCWMGKIKRYVHAFSVSDNWGIGHHLGVLDSIASDIGHFEPDGLVTQDGQFVSADMVVRCTGFGRNVSIVAALSPYTLTDSINFLDQDVMYFADALLGDEVLNSMLGSSVLEMAKFFCSVYLYFFKHKEEYRTLRKFLKAEEVVGLSWDMADAITPSMQLDRRPYLYGCEGPPLEQLTKKAVEMSEKLSAPERSAWSEMRACAI